jgi:uncharacterized repeat protein (TIGR01451 family)
MHSRFLLGFVLCFSAFVASMGRAGAQDSLSAAVREQIATLQAEKAARTPAQQKVDSEVLFLARKQSGQAFGPALQALAEKLQPANDGRELVDIKARVSAELLEYLRGLGATIISSVPRFDAIRARLPLAQVETLAGRADVRFVRRAVPALNNTGAKNSEGDKAHGADVVRAAFKATGLGVKVGVLSDSVDFLGQSQATADLPTVTVLPGQDGLGIGLNGEGTAMLEIIHDLAPGADLFFASAFISEAQFAQNILDLRSAGCDVILDDVFYFDESPFQDGPVARAVNEVVADGALYFSSAGNEGNKNDGTSGTWEGDFVDGGPAPAFLGVPGQLHRFGANTYNSVQSAGSGAVLFWTDPLGASTNDYDLFLLDAGGASVVAASTNVQSGSQDAFEYIASTSAGQRLVILKAAGAAPRFLHLKNVRGRLGVSTPGAVAGHAASSGALAMAAVDSRNAFQSQFIGGTINPVETFCSDGPRHVFFFDDGTPITPGDVSATGGAMRAKPDLAAADGVMTTVPAFPAFFGTSAAAPHAGAVAALLLSHNRTLTPLQIRNAMFNTALDIEEPGPDRDSGTGLVMATRAIQTLPGGPIISPEIVNVTGESFLPVNGSLDPGETVTLSVTLRNIGKAPTQNLIATLVPSDTVAPVLASQSYGALAANGGVDTRNLSFQVNTVCGKLITPIIELKDGSTSLGTVRPLFIVGHFGAEQTFTNAAPITINDNAPATPYPSSINVAGVQGSVGLARVTLHKFSHTYPADIRVLLVSPSGRKVLLMARAGGPFSVSNLDLTFDDYATRQLPDGSLTTGAYLPTVKDDPSVSLATPAPEGPYAISLGTFAGDTPNGAWQLYVLDAFPVDSGSIAQGWTLEITPATCATNGTGPDLTVVMSVEPKTASIGETVTYLTTVLNNGAAVANGVSLNGSLSPLVSFIDGSLTQGSGSLAAGRLNVFFGTIPVGGSATVEVTAAAKNVGVSPLTASVSSFSADNNPANNSGSASVTIGSPNLGALPVIVATARGSSENAPLIQPTDQVFLNLVVRNIGSGAAPANFSTEIYVDGILRRTFRQELRLAANATDPQLDIPIGSLPPGEHTVRVQVDSAGQIDESDEFDNQIVRTFFVAGPNLTPVTPPGWSNRIVVSKGTGTNVDTPVLSAGAPVFADIAIANSGALTTGAGFQTELYLDGILHSTRTVSAPLAAGESDLANDISLGSLSPGVHTLTVKTDAAAGVPETDETDNEFTRTFLVNGVPTITALADAVLHEGGTTGSLEFIVGDVETTAANLRVTATSSNPSLVPTDSITLSGTGANRTINATPAAQASGEVLITITVTDELGASAARDFFLQVLPVNDAPTFAAGPGQTVREDAGPQTVPGWAHLISAGPANEAGQEIAFLVNNDNSALFAAGPAISADGTLTFTPAPNAFGTANLVVQARDSGGTANGGTDLSDTAGLIIQVLSVNDAPTFVKGPDVVLPESAPAQTFTNWASGIHAGPDNESAQSLEFAVSTNQPGLFSAMPAITVDDTLTFTPAPEANGIATVTVRLHDDGGAANGGSDLSAAQTFTITLNSVNNPPTFRLGGDLTVAQDEGPRVFPNFAADIRAGPADEAGQHVAFNVSVDQPALFTVPPTIEPNGTLHFTPALSGSGTATATVLAQDDGDAPGISAAQAFTITVTSFAEEIGTYNGLVEAAPETTASHERTGLIQVSVAAGGGVTGKLKLGASNFVFNGSVRNTGQVRFAPNDRPALELLRAGRSTLSLALTIDVAGGSDQLIGTITEGGAPFASIVADRGLDVIVGNPIAASVKLPAFLPGNFTAVFAAKTPDEQGLPAAIFPQGDGFASFKVRRDGVVRMAGRLADGTLFSYVNALSRANRFPLFIRTDTRRGSISSWIQFPTIAPAEHFRKDDLLWFKPRGGALYPDGWAQGIRVDFAASRFLALPRQTILPYLPKAGPDGNATLRFTDGNVPPHGLEFPVKIRADNSARVLSNQPVALTLDTSTGAFSGTFIHPLTRESVEFNGAVLQSEALGLGFFLGPTRSGSVTITPHWLEPMP